MLMFLQTSADKSHDVQVENDGDDSEVENDSVDDSEDVDFYDSDYGMSDDDVLFENNVDKGVEWIGCGRGNTNDQADEYTYSFTNIELKGVELELDSKSSDDCKAFMTQVMRIEEVQSIQSLILALT